jgi:cysteinyl-tRNA synthetase
MLKIYNTLARDKQEFVPIVPGKVGMYVCGMTVYDYCHLGHARVLVVFDMVYRWLKASGFEVNYVRNITDIDDKIIKRASENPDPKERSIHKLTQFFTNAMHEDADALGVLHPDHEPRATQYVPEMLEMIAKLEANGLAYRAADGDVNFAVRKFPGYGKLSGKSLEDLRAGERVDVTDSKQDPLDFVLWKHAKDQEAEEVKWESPWGKAYRMFGDGRQAARRAFRHSRRRRRPAVPASRERDRAKRGRAACRRQAWAVRELLDA